MENQIINSLDFYFKINPHILPQITHLYFANQFLETLFNDPTLKEEFNKRLKLCAGLKFLNLEYNTLSAESLKCILENLPNEEVKVHMANNPGATPFSKLHWNDRMNEILDVAAFLYTMFPKALKFHRHGKSSNSFSIPVREVTTNLTMSVVVTRVGLVVLVRDKTVTVQDKFKQIKNNNGNSLKLGQLRDSMGCIFTVVLKVSFSNSSVYRELLFSRMNNRYIANISREYDTQTSLESTPKTKHYLVSKYYGPNDGFDFLRMAITNPINPAVTMRQVFALILETLAHHILGIVILDIKPENYIYNPEEWLAFFVDYDSAQFLTTEASNISPNTKITYSYASPELRRALFEKQPLNVTAKQDHYSLALCIREILFPRNMFINNNYYLKQSMIHEIDERLKSFFHMGISVFYGNDIAEMLDNALKPCLTERNNFLTFVKLLIENYMGIFATSLQAKIQESIRIIRKRLHLFPELNYFFSKNDKFAYLSCPHSNLSQCIATYEQALDFLNEFCRLHVASTYIINPESVNVSDIKSLWDIQSKPITELDKNFEENSKVTLSYRALRI